jgi:hypothetical protein
MHPKRQNIHKHIGTVFAFSHRLFARGSQLSAQREMVKLGRDALHMCSQFRVKGVDGLRILDASGFHKIPSFYIVLGVYMILEKAVDSDGPNTIVALSSSAPMSTVQLAWRPHVSCTIHSLISASIWISGPGSSSVRVMFQ